MQPVRVLLVDDSLFFRSLMERELGRVLPPGSRLETAGDPFEARDAILRFVPDVMILDVEMPRMDGIEFLTKLLAQYDQPTIVVTGDARYEPLARAAGARDFLQKPVGCSPQLFFTELARRIERIVMQANAGNIAPPPSSQVPAKNRRITLIALGASTGGTEALATVIHSLVPPLPPIVIVQHIPPGFSYMFAKRLDRESALYAKEAQDGDVLEADHIYVAPGDQHLRVRAAGGRLTAACAKGARVNGHCPSVDVLFRSVAEQVGSHALGAIFTGMGADGAEGLRLMREAGAHTIGQDERSCVVYGMPRAAYELGAVERQLPLDAIPGAILALAGHA
ncbi:chemotaxis-specific protein-glutamate methyltransferase CheB [Selenomonas sp.]|uniref:chemotaxis-specific protein-glutamate methyltransferase CheB n=1 Tax=Selenomonas sp. TaxID=2053611 RepID=UPI0025FC3A08|nr:chemotaxis-specific protein-glutamate methyltransferase CheB [Selenomonas sp.]MCI6284585.1 chemotaxis-specific protein-glutamate methyltransferase CheB [Selenomonas sp.]